MTPNIGFIRHHGAGLAALGRVVLHSALPFVRPKHQPSEFAPISRTLRAPPQALVDAYVSWCGDTGRRYERVIPPHMFAHWAVPLVAQQLLRTRYPLMGMINKGCGMHVLRPIRRDLALEVTAEVDHIESDQYRSLVHHKVSTHQQGELTVVASLSTLFLGEKRRSGKRQPIKPLNKPIGHWQAQRRDGWRFALLTGEFNPLHWCWPIARLSPFKGTILHGFGTFARSYEVMANALAPLESITVSFTRPVPLPSSRLAVMCDQQQMQLSNGQGEVFMQGQYSVRA